MAPPGLHPDFIRTPGARFHWIVFRQIFEMGDLMSFSVRVLKFGMSAAMALLSAGTMVAQSDSSEVVASVGGVKVTMAEL